MLIVIVGTPCSGKSSLASFLAEQHGFRRVRIARDGASSRRGDGELVFDSSTAFLDHATKCWRSNFVTTDLRSRARLLEFLKRPFVAVVNVSAPVLLRHQRSLDRPGGQRMTLEEFVAQDDETLYGNPNDIARLEPSQFEASAQTLAPPMPSNATPRPSPPATPSKTLPLLPAHSRSSDPLATLIPLATVTLHNAYTTFTPFHSLLSLEALGSAMRPSWDAYFMLLASLASMRSNCMKRRVGAVLVRDKRVVSTGYNGTPRGVKNCAEGGCARCNSHSTGFDGPAADGDDDAVRLNGNGLGGSSGGYAMGQGLEECVCLHAEENALLEAGRERVSGGGTTGAILYCNTCPCLRCTVKIVQCGVTEVVYSLSYSMDDASRSVLTEAGIGLRQIEMPPFP